MIIPQLFLIMVQLEQLHLQFYISLAMAVRILVNEIVLEQNQVQYILLIYVTAFGTT